MRDYLVQWWIGYFRHLTALRALVWPWTWVAVFCWGLLRFLQLTSQNMAVGLYRGCPILSRKDWHGWVFTPHLIVYWKTTISGLNRWYQVWLLYLIWTKTCTHTIPFQIISDIRGLYAKSPQGVNVYSYCMPMIPSIRSGSTATLTRIKCLLCVFGVYWRTLFCCVYMFIYFLYDIWNKHAISFHYT